MPSSSGDSAFNKGNEVFRYYQMVPFQVPESAGLIIEGAQAGSQAQALALEKGATTPLKKKVPPSEEQKTGSGEPTSTPLRSKNKQHLSNANSKTKISQKLSARDHADSLTKKSENKHRSKGN